MGNEMKLKNVGGQFLAEKNGLILNATALHEISDKLNKTYGPAVTSRLHELVTTYLRLAAIACDVARAKGSTASRADSAKPAMDYLRVIADGAEQLFSQVKAKSN